MYTFCKYRNSIEYYYRMSALLIRFSFSYHPKVNKMLKIWSQSYWWIMLTQLGCPDIINPFGKHPTQSLFCPIIWLRQYSHYKIDRRIAILVLSTKLCPNRYIFDNKSYQNLIRLWRDNRRPDGLKQSITKDRIKAQKPQKANTARMGNSGILKSNDRSKYWPK